MFGKLLCRVGLHRWHPACRIFDGYKVSKEMCTGCGKRRWFV